jgi:putative Holliday junction resolvase
LLAVDWGERRFGLAVSDETQTLARPLAVLPRRPGKRFPMPKFLQLVAEARPVGLVVGLPLTPEGTEGVAAAAARELAGALGARTYLPVELVDERMTTARAHAELLASGQSSRGRYMDAQAAAVLLQHFLEIRRNRTS